jgi:hypothetical protein
LVVSLIACSVDMDRWKIWFMSFPSNIHRIF